MNNPVLLGHTDNPGARSARISQLIASEYVPKDSVHIWHALGSQTVLNVSSHEQDGYSPVMFTTYIPDLNALEGSPIVESANPFINIICEGGWTLSLTSSQTIDYVGKIGKVVDAYSALTARADLLLWGVYELEDDLTSDVRSGGFTRGQLFRGFIMTHRPADAATYVSGSKAYGGSIVVSVTSATLHRWTVGARVILRSTTSTTDFNRGNISAINYSTNAITVTLDSAGPGANPLVTNSFNMEQTSHFRPWVRHPSGATTKHKLWPAVVSSLDSSKIREYSFHYLGSAMIGNTASTILGVRRRGEWRFPQVSTGSALVTSTDGAGVTTRTPAVGAFVHERTRFIWAVFNIARVSGAQESGFIEVLCPSSLPTMLNSFYVGKIGSWIDAHGRIAGMVELDYLQRATYRSTVSALASISVAPFLSGILEPNW